MENYSGFNKEDHEEMELPPGFRFHPTDEELISHYLCPKVLDNSFNAIAIGEADLNKVEPWDLPRKAKIGEKEWFFFCVRDKKYPTGMRTNRATEAGYWKATGKDKEIFKGKSLIGMKKTLVFYTGRAPTGQKTNWVMHEYRLEGKYCKYNQPKTAKNEWVISRVFDKSVNGKKVQIPTSTVANASDGQPQPSSLPPLMDSSPYSGETKANTSHVTCFSNPMEDHPNQNHRGIIANESYNSSSFLDTAASSFSEPFSFSGSLVEQISSDALLMGPGDQSILRLLMDGDDSNITQTCKLDQMCRDPIRPNGVENVNSGHMANVATNHEMGQKSFVDSCLDTSGPIDLYCLWNYCS